jgi:hypothetical protein
MPALHPTDRRRDRLDIIIVTAMARALFVQAYASQQEELQAEGRRAKVAKPGQDWMDVAPPTPQAALFAAHNLCGRFEELNGMEILALFAKALRADRADGRPSTLDAEALRYSDTDPQTPELARLFGHYLAMEAVGHGVSWFDDHERFELKFPFAFDFDL